MAPSVPPTFKNRRARACSRVRRKIWLGGREVVAAIFEIDHTRRLVKLGVMVESWGKGKTIYSWKKKESERTVR